MEYYKHLPERPFRAIQNGTKKIEGRVPKSNNNEYQQMHPGDKLIFEHEDTGELLETEILFVHHYPDFQTMLASEGVENVLSSQPKTIEHGVASYNSLTGYQDNVKQFGVYAIGVKPLTQK